MTQNYESTSDWVENNDLWDLAVEFRDRDSGLLNVLSSDIPTFGDYRHDKYNSLRNALDQMVTNDDISKAEKRKFISHFAPDADDGEFDPSESLIQVAFRLYRTPLDLIASSYLDPRNSNAPIPNNPLNINIDISKIPDHVDIQERDGEGITKAELKAALLVDQLTSWDEDMIERKIVDQGGPDNFETYYDGIIQTMLEMANKADVKDATRKDFQSVLEKERERVQDVINNYQWNTPNSPTIFDLEDLNNKAEEYEVLKNELEEENEDTARQYATVREVDSLHSRVDQLVGVVKSKDNDDVDVSKLKAQLETILEQMQANEQRIEELESSTQTSQREISDLRADFNRVNKRVQSQIEEVEEALDEGQPLADLENRIVDIEIEVSELQDHTQNVMKETAETLEEYDHRLSILEDHRDELREDIERLKQEINNNSGADVDELLAELEDQKEALAELEETIDKVESETSIFAARLEEEGIDQASLDAAAEIDQRTFNLLARSALSRFESSMRDSVEYGIYIPDSESRLDVPDAYDWDGYKTIGHRQRESALPTDADDQSMVNTYWEFEVTTPSGLIGRSTEIALEVVVYGKSSWFDANKDDEPTPLTIDQLCEFLEDPTGDGNYYTRAENASYHRVLCVVAPTGVSDSVKEALTEEQRWSRIHPDLSVCIADLQAGKLIYDDRVSAIEENSRLFDHFTAEDEQAAAEEKLEELSRTDGVESVSMSEMTEEHGFPAGIVFRTFKQFELDGNGELVDLDDYGMELKFR